MSTEIARDIADEQRYDKLMEIACSMGLNVKTNVSLWKDTAFLVLNEAILQSFAKQGVRYLLFFALPFSSPFLCHFFKASLIITQPVRALCSFIAR